MLHSLTGRPGQVIAILFLVTGISCSKNNDNPPSKTALLTSSNWKLVAQTYHGDYDGDGTVDAVDYNMYADFEACEKDNFMKFNTDGSGIADEGPSKCDAADPQTETVEWLFKENETILKIQQGFIALDFKILELTSSTLKLEFTDTITGSGDKITETFSH